MRSIEVVVSGLGGCGKSAVARKIEIALLGVGLHVTRLDDNGHGVTDCKGVIENSLDVRLASIARTGGVVNVRTVLIARRPGADDCDTKEAHAAKIAGRTAATARSREYAREVARRT